MTLLDAIRKIIGLTLSREKIYCQVCKVIAVDWTSRTCTVEPLDDGPEIFDVRLQGTNSLATGFVVKPVIDSYVVIAFLNQTTAVVVMTSEIDAMYIKTDLVEFNGGTLDGMVKVGDLVNKLNAIENAFNAHVHPTAATGPPSTPTPVPGQIPITPTIQTDIENTKIKQ